jgi:hypothetical protein
MTYMMSKQGYLNDATHNWCRISCSIFRARKVRHGADLLGAPPMLNPQFQDLPEALSVIMMPVTHWSDGTSAPKKRR